MQLLTKIVVVSIFCTYSILCFASTNKFKDYFRDGIWSIEVSKGVQIIKFEGHISDWFWGALLRLNSENRIRKDLPTLFYINSFGGLVKIEHIGRILPGGDVYQLFSEIENQSKTPIYALTNHCGSFCKTIYTSFRNRVALKSAKFLFHAASSSTSANPLNQVVNGLATRDSSEITRWQQQISESWLDQNSDMFLTIEGRTFSPEQLVNQNSNIINKGVYKEIKNVVKFIKSQKNAAEEEFQFYKGSAKEIAIGLNLVPFEVGNDPTSFKNPLLGAKRKGLPIVAGTALEIINNAPLEFNGISYYFVRMIPPEKYNYPKDVKNYMLERMLRRNFLVREYTRVSLIPVKDVCKLPDCEITIKLSDLQNRQKFIE